MSISFQGSHLPCPSVRLSVISAVLCSISLLSVSSVAAAQSGAAAPDTQLAMALPGVVITATRTPLRVDQSVAEVTVIERADLERATGRTISEILSQHAGIQFTANGGLGKTSSIFLRGLEARHTLLLVDGVRYGSATVGEPNLDNLPLGEIERIEIVRGPLSGLYGSDAVGGVIQVFTRQPTEGTRLNGSATLGSKGYGQGNAGISFADGLWSGALQLQHTENRGFSVTNERVQFGNFNPDDDGFRQNAGSLNLGLKLPEDWQLKLHLLDSKSTTALDDGLGADAKAALHTQVAALEASGRVTGNWRTLVRVARSEDDYNTLSTASFYDLGTIATVQQQLSWENTVPTPVGMLLVLGEHLKQKVAKPVSNYEITQRTVNSAALGLNGEAGVHTWQASLRRDSNSQYGQQTNGSLGYGLQVAPDWRLTAAAGTSFTAPSFNQLYWPQFSNPLLQPEEGRHAELGLRYSAGVHQVRMAVFGNRIRGYITSGANPTNLPYATSNGVSLAYDGQVGAAKLGASVEHVDPRNADKSSANYGKQLIRRAKDSAKLSADWDLGRWSAGTAVQAYSERYDDTANALRLGGFATADVHAQWQFERDWALQARLNNLADKRYETALGYNQPGRELYVTLRYSPR
ncbi:MAG: TonB-dependent receptor [Leptothrix sp. (in: b-proteobacteria)]